MFNTYPNFSGDEGAQFPQTNNNLNNNTNFNNTNFGDNNLMSKILPMLVSGKGINEILPSLGGSNPLISSLLSATNKETKQDKKIESDKIDISTLYKVN